MRKFDPMNETPLGLLLKEVRILKEKVDSDLADNYPPYDKVTRGDIIAAVKGKGKKTARWMIAQLAAARGSRKHMAM